MATSTNNAVSREVCDKVAAELREHAIKLFAKYGLEVTSSKAQYGDKFTFKIDAVSTDIDENGINLNSVEAQYYTRFGFSYYSELSGKTEVLNVPLGTKFQNKGTEYIFAGIASRKRKFPIVARRVSDGAMFGFAEGMVAVLNKAGA